MASIVDRFGPGGLSRPASGGTYDVVKDANHFFHLVPTLYPVPGETGRQSLTASRGVTFFVQLESALKSLGATGGQIHAFEAKFSGTQIARPYTVGPQGDPNAAGIAGSVTDIGIPGIILGAGGLIAGVGDIIGAVDDPFVPGQTTSNAPRPGDVPPNERPGSSDTPARTATKAAAGAAAGKVAATAITGGLLGATGGTALILRVLLALGGFALLLLGLEALTGSGEGGPIGQAKRVAKRVA